MAELTEIYICGKGQSLKEGKAVYSDDIRSKNEAMRDAKSRCDRDAKIAKIGYYTVNENGDFRCMYMHTANATGGGDEKKPATVKRKRPVAKPKPKASLWQKITGRG